MTSEQHSEAHNLVSDQLESGEKVLWVGKPIPSRVGLHKATSGIVVVGFFMFIAILNCVMQFSKGRNGRVYVDNTAQIILFVGLLLAIAYVLVPPMIEANKAKHTIYGITNRRVLIITPVKGRSEPEVFSHRGLLYMKRRNLSNGKGDLVFSNVVRKELQVQGKKVTDYAGLFGVENVAEVERLIMEVLPGSTSTPAGFGL